MTTKINKDLYKGEITEEDFNHLKNPFTSYYTPVLNEFYVGFEFEHLEYKGKAEEKWVKWDDFTNYDFYEDSPTYAVQKDIKEDKIRVKVLDKEDIESFHGLYKTTLIGGNYGFYETEDDIWEPENYLSNRGIKLRLNYNLNYKKVPTVKIEFFENNYQDWYICFEGRIRNKSELKKVLDQIFEQNI